MTTLHVPPQQRFLRVVRTLALVSTIGSPVVVSFAGVGCSSSSSDDGTGDSGHYDTGVALIDAGISASPDTRPDSFPTGTLPPPDTGHDSNDDADAIAVDSDGAVTDADAEVGIGGPLRAPEMPDEAAA